MIRSFDLVNYSQVARATDYLSYDYSETLSALTSKPIVYLDIGAGGDNEPIVEKYSEEFETINCEPRISESFKFKDKGSLTIEKAISDENEGKLKAFLDDFIKNFSS